MQTFVNIPQNAMKVLRKQPNSKDCLICGISNPYGLKAAFYEMEDASVIAVFSFSSLHQSYPERTHGGMISAIIDETIGRAIWASEPKTYGCTLRLTVSFHQAVPYEEKLYCIGVIDKKDSISFRGHAEIRNAKGQPLARGEAIYMRLSLNQIAPKTAQDGHIHPEDFDIYVPDDVKEIDIGRGQENE